MPRKRPDNDDGFSSDSFLDIVANIVGILIILVMVVGVRVKHAPAKATQRPAEPPTAVDLEAPRQAVGDLQQQIGRQQAALTDADARQRSLARQLAAARRQAAEQEKKNRALGGQLGQAQKWEMQLQDALREKQQELGGLLAELRTTQPRAKRVVRIEHYPSSLSQTVRGDEAHFQFLGGRIVHVPFEALVRKFKDDARVKVSRSPSTPRIEAVVGPVGNFSLRYALQSAGYGRFGLERFTFIPSSNQLGETLDAALAPQSLFRQILASYDPNTTTITIWTYPDSFDDFRRLKREIYLLGYTVAARPLPIGQLISGSPDGTKSATQ